MNDESHKEFSVAAQLAEARRTIEQQETETCKRIARNATLASNLREAEAREAELRGLVERTWLELGCQRRPMCTGPYCVGCSSYRWLVAHSVALPETKEPTK